MRLVSVTTGKVVSIASDTIPLNSSVEELYNISSPVQITEKNEKLRGLIFVKRKENGKFKESDAFFIDDQIEFFYSQPSPFGSTKVEVGFAECDRGLYYRNEYDINSNWKSFHYPAEGIVTLREFLTNNHNVELPKSDCFDISFIIKDKTVQETRVYIDYDN